MNHLFCFGMGYTAQALARRLSEQGWKISGTTRQDKADRIFTGTGYECIPFDQDNRLDSTALNGVTHVLVSIPPDERGDLVLRMHANELVRIGHQFEWIGYLSTTGVYGDRQGEWVDEVSPLNPSTRRGELRLVAEKQWLDLFVRHEMPVHIFRLAGIYGPGSNQLIKVLNGTAQRRIKPGQVFSRIHVDDIAGILMASFERPDPGRIYNVCDNEAAPPQDVVSYACKILGITPPDEIPYEPDKMPAMGRSFFSESKRVSNRRLKDELGYKLQYPTYREGLESLLSSLDMPA